MPHAHSLVLMGEAGIGKTRLAEETARQAWQQGWSVIWTRSYEQERDIPYRLWSITLRSILLNASELARLAAEPEPVATYQPLRALVPEIQEVLARPAKYGSDVALLDVLPPEQEDARLREAFFTFFTSFSLHTPLLLILDDIQWIDSRSSDMLGHLIRRMTNHPIVILTTCKEMDLAANRALSPLVASMLREQVVELMHIHPLSDEQIGALISDLPTSTITRIQHHVAGNPFFAEELANDLRTRGALVAQSASGQSSLNTIILPETIEAVLDQRLKRLSQECRDLLNKVAVLGGSFNYELITALESGQKPGDDERILDLLDEAGKSGVLTEEGWVRV